MFNCFRSFLLIAMLSGVGSCATFMSLADYDEPDDLYFAGTRLDFALLTEGSMHGSIDGTVWFLALVDMPLSLTLDTALLPFIVVADLTAPPRTSDLEDESESE